MYCRVSCVHLNMYVCLFDREPWGEQCDCEYLRAAPSSPFFCFFFILKFDPVQTLCPPVVAVVSLVLSPFLSFCPLGPCTCAGVCVCDCRSGLGRLKPPCWTWLNVLITGSGTPMRSVNAWKVGSRSRSASYRYTGGMCMCMASRMYHRRKSWICVYVCVCV